jgi:hypothetical protein
LRAITTQLERAAAAKGERLTTREIAALMQDYSGRPTSGTTVHKSAGRYRQITRLP